MIFAKKKKSPTAIVDRAGRSAFREVTDRIIHDLEQGTAPWQRPWTQAVSPFPRNAATGTAYRGINVLLLLSAGFSDPRWCTFDQAKRKGWGVRRGERPAAKVYFYKPNVVSEIVTEENEDGEEVEVEKTRQVPFLRDFKVYNAEQLYGVPPLSEAFKDTVHWEPIDIAEKICERSGADIRHGGNRAYYQLSGDYVRMPLRKQFANAADYYSVLVHELGHWTGHPTRLHRKFGLFGDPSYAREELRAEIASAMMSAMLGLTHDPARHSSYVKSWIETLRNDKREIFRAARDAQRITDHLLQFAPELSARPDVELDESDVTGDEPVEPDDAFADIAAMSSKR